MEDKEPVFPLRPMEKPYREPPYEPNYEVIADRLLDRKVEPLTKENIEENIFQILEDMSSDLFGVTTFVEPSWGEIGDWAERFLGSR